MVESGVKDIFLSNEVVDKRKLERFIKLTERGVLGIAISQLTMFTL